MANLGRGSFGRVYKAFDHKKKELIALKIIKNNNDLRRIPVVVLTTSNSPKDIEQCYALGANCFMTKPSSYEGLNDAMKTLRKFWFELSHLPIKY